jgi:pimeloyl-ACP methyl ester carboxylesterase
VGGAALVLLHGALGDAGQLAPLSDRLVAAGSTAPLLLELPGHGVTPSGDAPFRIESFAAAVLEELDRRGIARASFFGYSMGGYVALHLAATNPHRVERVATLGTKLDWSPQVAERECAMLDADTIRLKVPRFAAALAQRHAALGWERLLNETAGLLRSLGARPLLGGARFAAIPHPTRIGVGDRDATVSIEESAAAARQLPNGELEVHPRTPHPFEKVPLDRVARSLADFFA